MNLLNRRSAKRKFWDTTAAFMPQGFSAIAPLLAAAFVAFGATSLSCGRALAAEPAGAVSIYAGRYSRDTLLQIFTETLDLNFDDRDYVGVIAVSRVLKNPTASRSWEFEAQFGKHFNGQDHEEINLAVFHRWRQFPWNRAVRTTMAIGSGLSYAFEDPPLEAANNSNDGTTRLQHYLGLEATLAPPAWQRFSILLRIHHRSTVGELFGGVDSGSNYLSLGGRYEF